MRKKHISKIFVIVPAVICICITVYIVFNVIFSPYWDSVYTPTGYFSLASMRYADTADTVYTKQQACEDLDYIVKYIGRVHPLYIDGISDEINNLLQKEKDSYGEEVTAYEIWRSAARIIAKVGDPETLVMPSFEGHYLVDYINKIYDGYTLVSVNGQTVEQIFSDNSELFSFDTEQRGRTLLTPLLQTLEGYNFLHIDYSSLEITYSSPEGNAITAEYSSADFYTYDSAVEMITAADIEPYTSEINADSGYGIVTVNTCEYDSEFKKFIYNFFGEIDDNNIKNIIIDMRNADSGSSQIADEIIMYLDEDLFTTPGGKLRLGPWLMEWSGETQKISHYDDLLYDGDVYLLVSNNTLSSGTMAAELLMDNGFVVSVGEPCGSMPMCYGDVAVFQTPNSVLSFQISTKQFNRIDESKASLPLEPDIKCDADDALNNVLRLIEQK